VKVAEDSLYLQLQSIRQMYEHYTVGDTIHWGDPKLMAIPTQAKLTPRSGRYTDDSPETNDVIVFVHGWRMKPEERRSYAETAYKRLFWQGYDGRFILFSWPTQWANYDTKINALWSAIGDPGNFARSEEIAFHSGAALAKLLQDLHGTYGPQGGKINIVAHSMGNIVVGEALRKLVADGAGKIVDTYVASQAAMGADAYIGSVGGPYPPAFAGYLGGDNPWFRHIDDAAVRIVNFFNPDDVALTNWEVVNDAKADWYSTQSNEGEREGLPGFGYKYYQVDGTSWWRENAAGQRTQISFPTAPYEMFAYLAHDDESALGRVPLAEKGGPVNADVDLSEMPFLFKDDHSGQFTSDIVSRREYWRELMSQSGLEVRP